MDGERLLETKTTYEEALKQIDIDTVSASRTKTPVNDSFLLESVMKEQKSVDPEYNRRNKLYSDLLENYFDEYKLKAECKRKYKGIFFVVTLLCFFGIIAVSLFAIVVTVCKEDVMLSDLAVVAGSVAGAISALITLPKIIAQHLFPTDEDSNMISMVKNMQLNDAKIRNALKGDIENK